MTESEEVNWFVCLIAGVSKQVKENNAIEENENFAPRKRSGRASSTVPKKQSDVKRTIVLASPQPTKVLLLMNSGEDDNIVSAAEKAIPKSRSIIETSNSMIEEGLRNRFGFVCMLGPIPDKMMALRILATWEKSRGSISRTNTASILAKMYNIKFSINWEMLLATSPHNRKVHVIDSSIEGESTLYIYTPRNSATEDEKKTEVYVKEEYHIRPLCAIKKEGVVQK
jgi:hypothetical protein